MKNFGIMKDILKGICIGAGAILPGISSGVLCVIFGIYDKLVNSILGLFRNFKNNFLFLFPLGIGGIIGIILLGNILKFLLNEYPSPTRYAFIGLILGSIPLLIKRIHFKQKFQAKYCIYGIIAFVIGLFMVILEKHIQNTNIFNFSNELYICNILPISLNLLLLVAGFFMSIGIVVPRR